MPVKGKNFPGEKCPVPDPDICSYKVEDNAKYDKGEQSEIYVNIDKIHEATKKNSRRRYMQVSGHFNTRHPVM